MKWYVMHRDNAYITFDTLQQMYEFVVKLRNTDDLIIWYGYLEGVPEKCNRLFDK